MNNFNKYYYIFILLILLIFSEIKKSQSTEINYLKMIKNETCFKNDLPFGFVPVNKNNPYGPITIDRNLDDGTKRNFYEIIRNEDDSFYYDKNKFTKLIKSTPKKTEYLCELDNRFRSENQKGYYISCPTYYTIKIDKVFYGRYKNDTIHCNINSKYTKEILRLKKDCGYQPIKEINEICDGKNYCTIYPLNIFYSNKCKNIKKYLHIDYYCIKKKKIEKEKILIVTFYNGIKPNTIHENAVSEFYQYSNIHGYEFQFNYFNYNPERNVKFMKINTIIEKLIEGLKYKKYDWIVWVDTDIIILNPNLKLETFLPNEKMNKVHIIAADDYIRHTKNRGLNSGVLFIRVHEWSLNIFMRTISYYYFKTTRIIELQDQPALNNVLIESNEPEHYIIVPAEWFNTRDINKGIFLLHLMAYPSQKNKEKKDSLKLIKKRKKWYKNTNKKIRKKVSEYYNLPRDKQIKLFIE